MKPRRKLKRKVKVSKVKWGGVPAVVSSILFIISLLVVMVPLLVFVEEASSNPNLLSVSYRVDNESIILTVSYSGSIPLKDVKLILGNYSVDIGDLGKGSKASFRIPKNVSVDEFELDFNIFGLYPVRVVKNG